MISTGQRHTYLVLNDPLAHDRQNTVIFPPTLAFGNAHLVCLILPIRNMILILAFLFLSRMWKCLGILGFSPRSELRRCWY